MAATHEYEAVPPPARTMSSRLRTVEQAAADLGLSVHTIRAWIARRRIGHVRLGRAVRIPLGEIERLIERGTVPAVADRTRRVV